MKTVKGILFFLSVTLIIASCNSPSSESPETVNNFPLQQAEVVHVDDAIEKMAISDTWFAAASPNKITAVNLMTNDTMWTIGNLLLDKDSDLQIVNSSLIAATYDKVIVVDGSGQYGTVTLQQDKGDVIQLNNAYEDYVYVIRGPDWIMEVYDVKKNQFLWETWVGRGQIDTFYDSRIGIVYIVTPRSVNAFENLSGKLLWEQPLNVAGSVFDKGILYVCERKGNSNNYEFVAIDVQSQNRLWEREFQLKAEVYQLSIVKSMLIVTTRYNYFAIEKNSGTQIWQSNTKDEIFYHEPVELNNILYAKGSSGRVYAMSPNDGSVLGFILLEQNPEYTSRYDASQRVYRINDGIAVSTNTTVLTFK